LARSSGEESPGKALRRPLASLEAVEARSSMLAGEIARDLPDFTVHAFERAVRHGTDPVCVVTVGELSISARHPQQNVIGRALAPSP
jgi:hypothetical protein